jgi:hypothetical protein
MEVPVKPIASTLNTGPCAACRNPDVCMALGRWCDVPEETKELARRTAEFQANDRRTNEEKIKDAVDFICNCPLGGD